MTNCYIIFNFICACSVYVYNFSYYTQKTKTNENYVKFKEKGDGFRIKYGDGESTLRLIQGERGNLSWIYPQGAVQSLLYEGNARIRGNLTEVLVPYRV